MTEMMLTDTSAAHPLRFVALRYFNVAGADPNGRTGQSTTCATHLIKVAAEAALAKRPGIEIFGNDYPTPDGTGFATTSMLPISPMRICRHWPISSKAATA